MDFYRSSLLCGTCGDGGGFGLFAFCSWTINATNDFILFKYRLWRKTRQPHSTLCFGADPNRNFDSSWMTNGTSRNPCGETYGGPRAFSEPETRALSKFITSLGDRVKAYLSLHSYGQYVLFPHGHTKDKAPDFDILVSGSGILLKPRYDLLSGPFFFLCLSAEYNRNEDRQSIWAAVRQKVYGWTTARRVV